MIKLGKGWAPEIPPDNITTKAKIELKSLLIKIFEYKSNKNKLRAK